MSIEGGDRLSTKEFYPKLTLPNIYHTKTKREGKTSKYNNLPVSPWKLHSKHLRHQTKSPPDGTSNEKPWKRGTRNEFDVNAERRVRSSHVTWRHTSGCELRNFTRDVELHERHYRSGKLYVNTVDAKHSKSSYHETVPE